MAELLSNKSIVCSPRAMKELSEAKIEIISGGVVRGRQINLGHSPQKRAGNPPCKSSLVEVWCKPSLAQLLVSLPHGGSLMDRWAYAGSLNEVGKPVNRMSSVICLLDQYSWLLKYLVY